RSISTTDTGHRALALTPPSSTRPPVGPAKEWGDVRVVRRDRLGGVLHPSPSLFRSRGRDRRPSGIRRAFAYRTSGTLIRFSIWREASGTSARQDAVVVRQLAYHRTGQVVHHQRGTKRSAPARSLAMDA